MDLVLFDVRFRAGHIKSIFPTFLDCCRVKVSFSRITCIKIMDHVYVLRELVGRRTPRCFEKTVEKAPQSMSNNFSEVSRNLQCTSDQTSQAELLLTAARFSMNAFRISRRRWMENSISIG